MTKGEEYVFLKYGGTIHYGGTHPLWWIHRYGGSTFSEKKIFGQMNVLLAAVAFLIGIFIDIGARKILELLLNVMFK
ncbi:hypothetical protein NQ318_005569 [Aromia moschata]|uniref:Uncharacterized protein n=1 Tax=Aromia moschata TaxID=1265417 RepID=A0AAV8XFC5_9CUCU|nr:hypothetical protein NQ318_005569 [Aromia moschata]